MNLSGWEPRKLSASASAHLDVIRAAAAWAVMWGHLRTLFFVDFQHLQGPGWLLGVPLAKRVRTEVRRRRVGNAAVLSAWLETRDRLREHGVAVDARMTVREVARAGTRLVDARGGWALEELGGLVDEALWSGAAAGRPGADAAWRAAEDIRLGLRRRSLVEQVAISVDVRSLRRVR